MRRTIESRMAHKQVRPFSQATYCIVKSVYDEVSSIETLVNKTMGASIGFAMDFHKNDPAEVCRLLDSHARDVPNSGVLEVEMSLFVELFCDSACQSSILAACEQPGVGYEIVVMGILRQRYEELYGNPSEDARVAFVARAIDLAFRFGLMLSRNHPSVANRLSDAVQRAE